MNVNEMTAAECADWRAKEDGWVDHTTCPDGWDAKPWKNHRTNESRADHPYPLTLDGAAAALPKGVCGLVIERKFDWFNGEVHAKAYSPMGWGRCGALWIHTYGPDELTARYRLAVACGMAEKENA